MKNIKTDYNRDHYYFRNMDGTPWIPIEEEQTIGERITKILLVVAATGFFFVVLAAMICGIFYEIA